MDAAVGAGRRPRRPLVRIGVRARRLSPGDVDAEHLGGRGICRHAGGPDRDDRRLGLDDGRLHLVRVHRRLDDGGHRVDRAQSSQRKGLSRARGRAGMTGEAAARRVIEDAHRARTFPAAAFDVGTSSASLWTGAIGTLTFETDAPPATLATPFDLASLTKPIATTSVVMELVRMGTLRLDEPVSAFFADWRGSDRDGVTVRDLLEHASGLPARLIDQPPGTRREFEHEIGRIKLEYTPRASSVYSDLGFILLAFLAADSV